MPSLTVVALAAAAIRSFGPLGARTAGARVGRLVVVCASLLFVFPEIENLRMVTSRRAMGGEQAVLVDLVI
jgi:hypothetical protein